MNRTSPRTLQLEGELDINTQPLLREALDAEAGESGDLVLDLSGLEFMDSSGLSIIIEAARGLADGESLILAAPAEPLLRLFSVTGIDQSGLVEIRNDVPHAQ